MEALTFLDGTASGKGVDEVAFASSSDSHHENHIRILREDLVLFLGIAS
jgi:hypothetical protein